MTFKIPGIPCLCQLAYNNSFIHHYRAGLCADSKSPMPCIMPSASHFTHHAPTRQISQPTILCTALSGGGEEPVQGRGQW